jgi:Tol biopolymer transport system component
MRQMRRTQDDIVTVSRDGADWRDITNDLSFDRYSRWSPDGTRIAFTSDRSGDSEIWICDSDGANPRQLTFKQQTGRISTFPVWSPDGSRIIYSSPAESYIEDAARSGTVLNESKLPGPQNGDLFVPWDWSPDGRKLAGRFRSPRTGAGFFSFDTGQFTRFSEADDGVPSWLPDSRHLVYSEGNKVILLDTQTLQRRELITTTAGEPRSPFVSRDGRLLYYVVHKNESDIWLLDLTAEK